MEGPNKPARTRRVWLDNMKEWIFTVALEQRRTLNCGSSSGHQLAFAPEPAYLAQQWMKAMNLVCFFVKLGLISFCWQHRLVLHRSKRRGCAGVTTQLCITWSRISRRHCSSRLRWSSGQPGWSTWSMMLWLRMLPVPTSQRELASSWWSGHSTGMFVSFCACSCEVQSVQCLDWLNKPISFADQEATEAGWLVVFITFSC